MRRMMVAGNWKMHGSVQFTENLVAELMTHEPSFSSIATLICPTYVHLSTANALLQTSSIALGAQNMSVHKEGAYTGEVSGQMLCDVGCQYVILGHSECREYFGEADSFIAEKVLLAQDAELTPVFCIGETLAQRESDQTLAVIEQQLNAVLSLNQIDLNNLVIAYEPVWAIGTGVTATADQAQAVHAAIRAMIRAKDVEAGDNMTILYGGSVKPDNAQALFASADIDGALVGGASLDAKQFIQICQTAEACQE